MYQLAAYNQTDSVVREIEDPRMVSEYLNKYPVVWLDMASPPRGDIEALGSIFGFHKLALEDCLHTTQRPKVDNYGEYFFLIIKPAEYVETVEINHMSVFVGKNYIVTVRNKEDDHLIKPLLEQIRMKTTGVMKNGTDYLCYLLVDTIVDAYLPIFDLIDDKVEEIEAEIIEGTAREVIGKIFKLKKDLLLLRKAIFPTMETVVCMQRGGLPNMEDKTIVYFSDVYDHVVEVVDLLETSRELVSGALDIHMSKTQNAINEVAKIFAMLAIILMWPSVIGAIYGMNFPDMPEYHWGIYGYAFALSLMAVMMVVTVVYFKKRGWV
ncbi:MAG: magnesium/cobalt transporter CorA [Candidatus Altiarchaeota archaeon]|nr:magnesium/cobalt transporter CorA [Candidatus Altiarchaeota archaeon]